MSTKEPAEMVVIRRVYEPESLSEHFEIICDSDGLGLIELRYNVEVGKTITSVSFSPEAAPFVASAILECAKELKAKEGK